MMHLTDDELYSLALLTEENQPYNSREINIMKHLKMCKSCYGKFCSALALVDVTSESGYAILSELYGLGREKNERVMLGERVLAAIKIVRKSFEDSVGAVIKQINQDESVFRFEQPLQLAARGEEKALLHIVKVEEADDERTFVAFDSKENKLLVHINFEKLDTCKIKVHLRFNDSETIEVPLEKKGRVLKGSVKDIPEKDFLIEIERIK